MSKRADGEGHIRKRADGRWEATLPAGVAGPKKKSFYGKSQTAVLAKMNEAKAELALGRDLVPAKLTVDAILEDWLAARKNSVTAGTWLRYEQFVRLHLSPNIGHIKASKLHARDLNAMYDRLVDKADLSPTTVNHIHTALKGALKHGMRLDLLNRNVADLATAPRPAAFEINPLNMSQVSTLVSAAAEDRLGALYVVAVTTGMREGELLGLRWSEVDLDTGRLRVRRSLKRQADHSLEIEETTKTQTSRRTLDLVPLAVETLARHRAAQAAERLRLGPRWNDNDLVFPNRLGKPMSASNLLRSFTPFLDRAGLPKIRFHDLRHTCATLLIEGGANIKVVSEYLGHSDVVTTLRIYVHVMPNMQADAIRTFGGQLAAAGVA